VAIENRLKSESIRDRESAVSAARAPRGVDGKIAAAGGTTLWTGCGLGRADRAANQAASGREATAALLSGRPIGC